METQLFTGTSVPKAYLKLSMPLVFSMVVTLIYNLADTYFVARTGNTDLVAGVSLGAPVFTLLMAVVNIVLDPLFISVLGLGAAGAAIATVIGYLFCDVYFLGVVLAQSKVLSVQPRDCRATPRQVGQILAVGIPSAVVNLMQSASMVLTNRFLLPYGNDKIAAMGIVLKVNMIVLLLLTGLAFGGQPLFGYYYGAGDKARFAGLLRFCVRFLGAVALVLSALVFAAAPLAHPPFPGRAGHRPGRGAHAALPGHHHGVCGLCAAYDHRLPVHGQGRGVLPAVRQPPGGGLSGGAGGGPAAAGIQRHPAGPGGGRHPDHGWGGGAVPHPAAKTRLRLNPAPDRWPKGGRSAIL